MGATKSSLHWLTTISAALLLEACGGAVAPSAGETRAAHEEPTELSEPSRLVGLTPADGSVQPGASGEEKPASEALRHCIAGGWVRPFEDAEAEQLHAQGQEQILQRNGKQAAALLAKAVEKAPEDASISGDLAIALLQVGCQDEAVSYAERAARLDPGSIDIVANLAQVYQIAGRIDAAIRTYRQAAELDPDDPGVQNNLAVLLVSRGELEKAEHHARTAVRLGEGQGSYLVNLGYILLRQKRLTDAEMVLRRAIRMDENNAAAHNQLGLVLAAQNRKDRAREEFKKTLAIDPEHKAAKENLEALGEGFDFIGPWNKDRP